jgi:hypothetical protein
MQQSAVLRPSVYQLAATKILQPKNPSPSPSRLITGLAKFGFFVLDKCPVDAIVGLSFIDMRAHEFDWNHKTFREQVRHKDFSLSIAPLCSALTLSEAPGSFWMKNDQSKMSIFGRAFLLTF